MFQEVEAPRFQDNRHMKVVRLSALRTGQLYPQFLVLVSVRGWVNPRGHSAAGRIMSMKNFNDTIGNRTRELLACSTVPQPTAPPLTPVGECEKILSWLIAEKSRVKFCYILGSFRTFHRLGIVGVVSKSPQSAPAATKIPSVEDHVVFV